MLLATIKDSDGEAVSIPDSLPTDRTPRQSPLAVKLTSAKSRPTYYRVTEGQAAARDSWRICDVTGDNIRTIIMTDSDGAAWTKVPISPDATVYALHGACLDDIGRVLEQAGPMTNIRSIVIAAGINDRNHDPSDVIAALRHLKTWGDCVGKQLLFVGTPTFHTLKPGTQRAVVHINQTAEDLFGTNYVQPVAEDQVDIVDQDD